MLTNKKYQSILLSLVSVVIISLISIPFFLMIMAYTIISFYLIKYFYLKNKISWPIVIIILILCLSILFLYKHFILTTGGLNLLLPIGISFYTFRLISFVFDLKNEVIGKMPNFIDYFLYLNFFPTFICGPFSSFEQFYESRKDSFTEVFYSSVLLFIRGAAKKILISQYAYDYVVQIKDASSALSIQEMAGALLLNVVFVTADLSAYSDIARGLAKVVGFNLPLNFDLSLLAKNISDFWKRQHVTFSNWLRQYIYYPVFFNGMKIIDARYAAVLAITITFLFSGFWHVPSWAGLLFATLHTACFILMIEKNHWWSYTLNFILMWITILSSFWFIVFPYDSLISLSHKVSGVAVENGENIKIAFLLIVGFLLIDLFANKIDKKPEAETSLLSSFGHALLIILTIVFYSKGNPYFLYFSF